MAVAGNRGGAGGARNVARAQRAPKPYTPTPAQLKAARAQRAGYVSQGQAVKRAAVKQRAAVLSGRRATDPTPIARAPKLSPTQLATAHRTQIVSGEKAVAKAAHSQRRETYKDLSVAKRRLVVTGAAADRAAGRKLGPQQKAALQVHHERHAGDVAYKASRLASARAQAGALVSQGKAVEHVARDYNAFDRAYRTKKNKDTGLTDQQANRLGDTKRAEYVSQGDAVAKAAKEQRTAAAKRQKVTTSGLGALHLSGAALSAGKLVASSVPGVRELGMLRKGMKAVEHATGTSDAQIAAPVQAALDQAERPRYAIMGAAKEDVKAVQRKGLGHYLTHGGGKPARTAAARGIALKEHASGGDVLKQAGVHNKYVRAVGGFAGDTLASPLTYVVPGGLGGVAEGAAGVAARQTARKVVASAAKAGAREAEAKAAREGAGLAARKVAGRAGAKAARRSPATMNLKATASKRAADRARAAAEAQGHVNRGLKLRVGGQEVQSVRRVTAKVARNTRAVTRQPPARSVVERESKRLADQAERAARATENASQAQAGRIADQARKRLRTDKEKQAVNRALDEGNIATLSPAYKRALKANGGRRQDALKAIEKTHPDEARLVTAAHDLRSTGQDAFGEARKVNAARDTHPENYLSKAAIASVHDAIETQRQKVVRDVTAARKAEKLAQSEAKARVSVADVRHQAREQAATQAQVFGGKVARVRQQKAAAVATERVRASEGKRAGVQTARAEGAARVKTAVAQGRAVKSVAVARERDIADAERRLGAARRRLTIEQRKPLRKRRGVAALDANVTHAQRAVADARRAAERPSVPAFSPAEVHPPAPVSAIRVPAAKAVEPVALERGPGVRVAKAADRAQAASDATARHTSRRFAVRSLPRRGVGKGVPITETHQAWLTRVAEHAKTHDLPIVAKRAEKLLSEAPDPKDLARGYFPREFTSRALRNLGVEQTDALKAARATRGGVSARKVNVPTAGHARSDPRKFSIVQQELQDKGGEAFTEDPALAFASHTRGLGKAQREADFARRTAENQGRRVRSADELRDGEKLYRLGVKGSSYGLHPETSVPRNLERETNLYHRAMADYRQAVDRAKRAGEDPASIPVPEAPRNVSTFTRKGDPTKPSQFYAIPEHAVNDMHAANQVVPRLDGKFLHAVDRVTAHWKGLAMANPMFHFRNAVGDISRLAEMPGSPLRNFGNLRAGATLARGVRQSERYRQAPGRVFKSDPLAKENTIKVNGQEMPVRELVKLARQHGIVDSGFFGREQFEMLHPNAGQRDVKGAGRVKRTFRAGTQPFTRDRENLTRLAAFKAGLDMGMKPGEAADLSHHFFIDYGKLSPTEKNFGRRVFPFYTWTAKSLPRTVANFAANPGRYANIDALRQEWNQSVTGKTEDQLRKEMSPNSQRQLPFMMPIGHGKFAAVSASWPVTLLNNLPTGLSGQALGAGATQAQKTVLGMLHPIARDLVETYTHHSVVSKREIEATTNPRVAAPDWVRWLPADVKRELKVDANFVDKRTGKKSMGWRGWAGWAWDQVPGLPGQASALATGTPRPGQVKSTPTAIANFLGVRTDELGPDVTKAGDQIQKYKRLADLNKQLGFLPETVDANHPTPEYKRLRAEVNKLNAELRPSKKKKAAAGFGAGGFGGSAGFGAAPKASPSGGAGNGFGSSGF